jgi:four helix bundle protein
MEGEKPVIRSFLDLDVYRTSYGASITVLTKIVPKLPKEEQFDLANQLRRSAKAVPRLIAESYSKRHQKRGFQALLDDAMQESNETVVSLSHTKDIYKIEATLCVELIDTYEKISRQLYRLSLAWGNFKERRPTKPQDDLRYLTETDTR